MQEVQPYIVVDDLLKAYDKRRFTQLLSDTGTPVSDGDLTEDENLKNLIYEATEMIRSAAVVGKKYDDDWLVYIARTKNVAGTAYKGGYLLRRVCCDLVYGLLVSRRGQPADDIARLAPRFVEALRILDEIRRGDLVFGGVEGDETHPDAGLPKCADLTLNANYPTNLPSTNVRLFGVRGASGNPYGC